MTGVFNNLLGFPHFSHSTSSRQMEAVAEAS